MFVGCGKVRSRAWAVGFCFVVGLVVVCGLADRPHVWVVLSVCSGSCGFVVCGVVSAVCSGCCGSVVCGVVSAPFLCLFYVLCLACS